MATSTLGSGTLVLAGTTSGTTTVTATAVAGSTTLTLPAATDTLVGKATTDTLTNKTLTGAAMNGTLGATTPSTASVTTLTTSSTITHNGGTANGVAYLNGSKALTTGSALVFDGTNLGVGVTPSAWTGAFKVLEIGSKGGALAGASGEMDIFNNAYNNGSNYIYGISSYATQFQMNNLGQFRWYNAPSGTAGNAITFTQAMTLNASGNLLVGTTTDLIWNTTNLTGCVIGGNASTGGYSSIQVSRVDDLCLLLNRLNTDGQLQAFARQGTQVGSISVTTSATAYNTSSDYRLKEAITPMTGALAKVAALKPVTYKWKVNGENGEGFIAHELAEVIPDCVTGEKDAIDADGKPQYQGVDTSFLVATLTAAIQEQQTLITQLTARITALESA